MRNFFALSLLALLFLACAQTKKAPALVPEEVPPPVPATPVELSVFDAHEAGCAWNRLQLPEVEVKTIAQFPSSCLGVEVAWSADLTRALVSFPPQPAPAGAKKSAPTKAGPQAFEVELASGNLKPLSLPPKLRGEVELFGITPEGIVALSLESSPQLEKAMLQEMKKKKRAKSFQLSGGGEKISIELPEQISDGMQAVAHAWLQKDGSWKRVESKFTTTGWDYGLGVRVLEAYGQFGPGTNKLLAVHSLPEAQALENAEPLSAWTPQSDDERQRWEKQSTPQGELFAWMTAGEFSYVTGLLIYQPKRGALSPLPGLGFGQEDLVAPLVRGTWLLVGAKNTGASPRVYDLRSGALAWSSDSARAVVFWPE